MYDALENVRVSSYAFDKFSGMRSALRLRVRARALVEAFAVVTLL